MKRSMLERLKSGRPAIDLSGFVTRPKLLSHPMDPVEADADLGDRRHYSNDSVPEKC